MFLKTDFMQTCSYEIQDCMAELSTVQNIGRKRVFKTAIRENEKFPLLRAGKWQAKKSIKPHPGQMEKNHVESVACGTEVWTTKILAESDAHIS